MSRALREGRGVPFAFSGFRGSVAERFVDSLQQAGGCKRLLQQAASIFERPCGQFVSSVAGHVENPRARVGAADPFDELWAAHAGHDNVRDHQVEQILPLQRPAGVLSVGELGDRVAGLEEHCGEQGPEILVILDKIFGALKEEIDIEDVQAAT